MKLFYLLLFSIFSTISYSQTNTVGTITNTAESLDGYTLFAPIQAHHTYLIDNCGRQINVWEHYAETRLAAELLPDGTLIRSAEADGALPGAITGGSAGKLQKVDWNSNVLWEFDYISPTENDSGQYITHHDFEVLPNGNILTLVWEKQPTSDLLRKGINTSYSHDFMWMEKIVEFEPVGTSGANIVWEWNLYDHLIQDFDATKLNYGIVKDNPQKVNINYKSQRDWTHINSIDYNENLDQILLTVREFNEIWIIDHSTTTAEAKTNAGGLRGKGGDLLYRWGNPESYNQGTSANSQFTHPHHAEWIPDGFRDGGKIMLYNNGNWTDPTSSKVSIFDPNINAMGDYPNPPTNSAYLPSSKHWEYTMDLSINGTGHVSHILSSVNRLENGNTLICSGYTNAYMIELDTNDNIVWEYLSPAGARKHWGKYLTQGDTYPFNRFTDLFRAIRYKPNYLGFLGQDLTPGLPIELNPNVSACSLFPDTTLEPIDVDEWNTTLNYTNPVDNILNLNTSTNELFRVRILNIQGQTLYESNENKTSYHIHTSQWLTGLYVLEITNSKKQTIRKKLIKQ